MSSNDIVRQNINISLKESNCLKKDINKSDISGNALNFNSNGRDIEQFIYYRKKGILFYTEEDYFNTKLNNELILMIFQFLSIRDLVQCTMVCKKWHELTYNEILWNNLNLFRTTLYETSLHKLLSKGVQILTLSQAKIYKPFMIKEIKNNNNNNNNNNNIDNMYKLKYLDLSMAMISVKNLSKLLSKCKFLEKLSLESCTLNTECCKEISNCIDISVLNLSMCGGLNLTGILSVLKLRSLTELNVAWCSFNKQQVDVICKMLPSTMTRLNISGCEENMSDLNLSDLILSCPNIKELDLSDNTSLTEDIFSELTNLHNLEHLSLSRCFNIKSLSKLDLNLVPYFEYLDIFDLELTSVPDKLKINQFLFTSIARPTLKDHKTIWGLYVKS